MFYQCFTNVLPIFYQYFTNILPMSYYCFYQCFTNVAEVSFEQCYGFPLILSSPFHHLLPDQLLARHHIFSSTNSKFNDMKSQRYMKIMFFFFTERILSSAFKTLSLPFLIKSKAFSICCTTIAKPSLQRGFPVPAKWDLFMKI